MEGNTFSVNTIIQEGGIVKHQCLSTVSSSSQQNHQLLHEYLTSDTSVDDVWIDHQLYNSYEPSFETVTLFNGDLVQSDIRITHIIDNDFTRNFRGTNGAIIYLERTPYFDIRNNRFTSNSILYLVGQLTSLNDFVSRATGLTGVTSIGNFELELN